MLMQLSRAEEIQQAIIDESVYQAWKGWCAPDGLLMYLHEDVITARHMIALGLDECEVCLPPTADKPDAYVLPQP